VVQKAPTHWHVGAGITARVLAHTTARRFSGGEGTRLVWIWCAARQSHVRRRWCSDMRHPQSTWRFRVVGSHLPYHPHTPDPTAYSRNQYTTDGAFGLGHSKQQGCLPYSRSGYVVPMGLVRCSFDDPYEHRGTQRQQRVSSHLVDAVWHPNLAVPETTRFSFRRPMQRRRRFGRYNPPPAT
jgi:hypothetical protein